jgi:hypothetical protein
LDPRWLNVHEPDEAGFLGFTALCPMLFRGPNARFYSEGGLVKAAKVRSQVHLAIHLARLSRFLLSTIRCCVAACRRKRLCH